MEQVNSLSLVKRHDGSYFYIIELGLSSTKFYKYMLAYWAGDHLGEPIMIYSHTKRSTLNEIDKEYFDNNLLGKRRLEKYINDKNNLYIGGIEKNNGITTKAHQQGVIIPVNYKVYLRDNKYILIEIVNDSEIKTYNINEFVNKITSMDFESHTIYTEKDLLHMEEETYYVINHLLNKQRVLKKLQTSSGYVGTISEVNGKYKKTFDEVNLEKIKKSA